MNTEKYKQQLLTMEQDLSAQIERAGANARALNDGVVRDAGDASLNNKLKEDQFKEADIDWTQLNQVRDALKRIEDETYGKCIIDGGSIEEKRLEAIPWTPYCLKHQEQFEAANPPQTPTL